MSFTTIIIDVYSKYFKTYLSKQLLPQNNKPYEHLKCTACLLIKKNFMNNKTFK